MRWMAGVAGAMVLSIGGPVWLGAQECILQEGPSVGLEVLQVSGKSLVGGATSYGRSVGNGVGVALSAGDGGRRMIRAVGSVTKGTSGLCLTFDALGSAAGLEEEVIRPKDVVVAAGIGLQRQRALSENLELRVSVSAGPAIRHTWWTGDEGGEERLDDTSVGFVANAKLSVGRGRASLTVGSYRIAGKGGHVYQGRTSVGLTLLLND